MKDFLFVGLGGATGSMLRYAVSRWAERALPFFGLPSGTLLVNVAGCLALGFLAGLADSKDLIRSEVRLLLMVGLLGGFTTFSTFGYEALSLARGSVKWMSLLYVVMSFGFGVLAAWLGNLLGRSI